MMFAYVSLKFVLNLRIESFVVVQGSLTV